MANALSRETETRPQFMILSLPSFEFIKQLRIENDTSVELQVLHKEVTSNTQAHTDVKYINGLLYRDGKLLLNHDSSLKSTLLQEYHSTYTGGHAMI